MANVTLDTKVGLVSVIAGTVFAVGLVYAARGDVTTVSARVDTLEVRYEGVNDRMTELKRDNDARWQEVRQALREMDGKLDTIRDRIPPKATNNP